MDIDFLGNKGNVVFNDFSLKQSIPLNEQRDELKEDMLQVEYPGGYLLDVGWRPSFNINGEFYICLIKDFDWDAPIYNGSAKDISSLLFEINQAIKRF